MAFVTSDKLPKPVVLYYPPPLIGEPEGAHCGRCTMFVEHDKRCTAVQGAINGETGVCGLYVHGPLDDGDNFGIIPKEIAGYTEEGPTHCGNCEYYGGNENSGPCEKVDGIVDFAGCCNHWEAK